jgi:C4-dicarboxylate-specific signal transduction histidine kinase
MPTLAARERPVEPAFRDWTSAETTIGRDAVTIRPLGAPAMPSDLPGSVLQRVIRDWRKAEDDLRRSEAALAETQQISHTGSWRWKVGTGEVAWSAEHFRIFALDPASTRPSHATLMERIHVEDRPSFEQAIQRAVRDRTRFHHEYRIVQPDGSVKHLESVGQPDVTACDDLEFVGTVMDITERRNAEEALRSAQAELARVVRFTMMRELAASLSSEINQPLGAILNHGEAGLLWLNRDEPNIDEARDAFACMVRNAQRAGSMIQGLRLICAMTNPWESEDS